MKNIKTVSIRLSKSKTNWAVLDVNLDFSNREEPKREIFIHDDGNRKHYISVHCWKTLDGKTEKYNSLVEEIEKNGLNNWLLN